MPDIEPAHAQQTRGRVLVANLTAQRVAGVGGIHDYAALFDDVYRLLDKPKLRIVEMDIKKLGHGDQVWAACKRSASGQSSQTGLQ